MHFDALFFFILEFDYNRAVLFLLHTAKAAAATTHEQEHDTKSK